MLNNRLADTDLNGYLGSAFLLSTLLVGKVWLDEGKPGLALEGSVHVFVMLGLAWLVTRKRIVYMQHRELLVGLAAVHVCWTGRNIAVRGGTNVFFHHGDSPLRLLGLLLACSHALWGPCYLLHNRIAAAAGYVALLLAALLPLMTAQSICYRLLLAPGVLSPLADLHTVLGAVHSAAVSPHTQLLASGASEPLRQCMAIELWLVAVVGILLPAAALHHLDRRARHGYRQEQLEALLAAGSAGAAGGASMQEQAAAQNLPLPPPKVGRQVTHLYLASCLAWCGVCALLALWRPSSSTAPLSC